MSFYTSVDLALEALDAPRDQNTRLGNCLFSTQPLKQSQGPKHHDDA